MPVEFLTSEQRASYGRYAGEPSPEQLARFFHLDETDHAIIRIRRGDHNRLGFAVQLSTVRFLGTFLAVPTEAPAGVVRYLAQQIGVEDPSCLARYLERDSTHREHAEEIQRRYGYEDFHDSSQKFGFLRWLYARAWLSGERPTVLLDLATVRLVESKVLLPGVSVLARLVAQVRERASARLWRALAALPDARQREQLQRLLEVSSVGRQTNLDRLRKAPVRVSSNALVEALGRLTEIRSCGVGNLELSRFPPGKVKALARHAAAARGQAIARMPEDRRWATLLAFARAFEITALDDAVDVLDLLLADVFKQAQLVGQKNRLRTLRDLDAAALNLLDACKVIVEPADDGQPLEERVFSRVARDKLVAAIATVEALARPTDEHYEKELLDSYARVRRFLPTLLRTIRFEGTQAGQAVLRGLEFLTETEPGWATAPQEFVCGSWLRWVNKANGGVDRRAYTLCLLESLQDKLRRRDIFIANSERWGDLRARLLDDVTWQKSKHQICSTLGRQLTPEDELRQLGEQLEAAYRRTIANLPNNPSVRIEQQEGRDTLVLSNLDKLDEPASLIDLRKKVAALLPHADLPEVLLEIQRRTGFAEEFSHISGGEARVTDLATSVCAVLIAEACNLGLEPVSRPDCASLTRDRLSWVLQNYLRAETLIQANARLVDAQARIPLAQAWGGGEVTSADGLRFVVPVRTINAGPNPKYFGNGRGITYYNFTSDQFTGFHNIVIPGTLRDSIYVLDGLLEQQTSLHPAEVMTDTAGASDLIFGLFWLLGYQFSPRLADIGEARFWRMNAASDYGPLNQIARHRINTDLIEGNWDDMLRIAGSLKLGTVSASELVRSILRSSRPSTLARAISELGRIPKTLHLLTYVDDEGYRRRILTQLNRGESRHDVSRVTFHGSRGEVRKHYREGQEDQLTALGLVVNVVVLWNTLYMDAALNFLRTNGHEVKPEDVARLSPLVYDNINFLGRYSFDLNESVAQGQLRPLRNLDSDEPPVP